MSISQNKFMKTLKNNLFKVLKIKREIVFLRPS